MDKLQFNSDKVVQLFYYDEATDSYIPVSSANPLPVHVDTTATVVIPSSLTVNQPTGTNLHTVVDSGSITVVQPTGSNLHIVLDSSNVNVQGQVHVVLDTSSVVVSNFPSSQQVTFSPGASDIFGQIVTVTRNNQIEAKLDTGTLSSLVTLTTSGTGTGVIAGGLAEFASGTGVTSASKGVSLTNTNYRPGHEIYGEWTAAFTVPTNASSYQKIGLYDSNNGFYVGYSGTSFGLFSRSATVDTFVTQASWNVDTLTGISSSKFTRNGAPEALDKTKLNVYRARFGWLGAAPIQYEVLSPDGVWVLFHTIRQPNTSTFPSVTYPDLPITVDVSKTSSDATNLIIYTACWGAGTTSQLSGITDTITANTLAQLTRSVITGVTTAGGGGYVNVKVNPSGTLQVGGIISLDSSNVSVTNFPAVQPVSFSGNVTVVQPTGSNLHVVLDSSASTIVDQNKIIRSTPVSLYIPGDNILVPGLSNKVVRVLACALQTSGTVGVKFKDGSNKDITGAFPLASSQPAFGISLSQPSYLFSTTAGNNLILNLDRFITVSGFITYFYDNIGDTTDNTWTLNDSYPLSMGMTFGI